MCVMQRRKLDNPVLMRKKETSSERAIRRYQMLEMKQYKHGEGGCESYQMYENAFIRISLQLRLTQLTQLGQPCEECFVLAS